MTWPGKEEWLQAMALLVLLTGEILLLLGLLWGEDLEVLNNARYICFECIGLG